MASEVCFYDFFSSLSWVLESGESVVRLHSEMLREFSLIVTKLSQMRGKMLHFAGDFGIKVRLFSLLGRELL